MIHRKHPHILICLKYNEKIKLKFTLDYAGRIKKMAEKLMVLRESSILGEFILFRKWKLQIHVPGVCGMKFSLID